MTTTTMTTTSTPNRQLARTVVESPIGELALFASDDAVVAIRFGNDRVAPHPAHDVVDVRPGEHALLDEAVRQLGEYFEGDRLEFELPLEPIGTPFQQQAWMALRDIPYGETISYGEQARRLGDRNKSRAVGAANGKNPIPIVVPCHRVVGANGHLTGFGGGIEVKAWLLEHELRVRATRRPGSFV